MGIACIQDRIPAPFSLFRDHLTLHVSIDVTSLMAFLARGEGSRKNRCLPNLGVNFHISSTFFFKFKLKALKKSSPRPSRLLGLERVMDHMWAKNAHKLVPNEAGH